MKTTKQYWNTLAEENSGMWEVIEGSDGNLTQLTIAQDPSSGDYTRLTKFKDGYCTKYLEKSLTIIQKKYLLCLGVYMMRHLISG